MTDAAQPTTTPIPEVYVLWHPRCGNGDLLARSILQWLRPGIGMGPEVFYRSAKAPGDQPYDLPLPLPGEKDRRLPVPGSNHGKTRADHQIIVPLIDENFVTELPWRYWLQRLAKDSSQKRTIFPVALDPTAYNMPDEIRQLNYLRPVGSPTTAAPATAEFTRMERSLLKQLTEAMCRLLLPRPASAKGRPGGDIPKVNVFLSHAKQDGAVPARRLRDYIYSQTQLAAFFDENDISYASTFATSIQNSLESMDTAALISVRSVQYAFRPWCRREFSVFRRPRQESTARNKSQRWRLYPSLVVEALAGRDISYGIPEAGNCPIIRWNEEDADLEELIITTVIRDAMLASFHSALGASLAKKPNQIVINWVPDPTTLLHIPRIRRDESVELLYPGRGLSSLELQTLGDFFKNVEFHAFEQVRQ
ncbi:MAG: toll/interleukin-1 receptor domain-containing protein [Reyranella sp.]|nr:toll/interleukin-1 receptor domain-containing protein [Reyranella sp.]